MESELSHLTRAQKVLDGVSTAHENRRVAKQQVREMCLYGTFVCLFTYVVMFGKSDQELFFFTEALRGQLLEVEFQESFAPNVEKTWRDVKTLEEMWQYFSPEGPMFKALYTTSTLDGRPFAEAPAGDNDDGGGGSDSATLLNRPGELFGTARVVGPVRFGQLRGTEAPCSLPQEVSSGDEASGSDAAWRCFVRWPDDPAGSGPAPFSRFPASPSPLADGEGPPLGYPEVITGLHWDADSTREQPYRSPQSSFWYGAPHVYTLLPNPGLPRAAENATRLLTSLSSNKFVDSLTRAVTVDLSVYNPSLDHVCLVRLVAEMPLAGGVLPWSRLSTVRVFRDHQPADSVRIVFEIVILVIVLYYVGVEVLECRREGLLSYIMDGSKYAHNLNLVLFLFAVGYRVAALTMLPATVSVLGSEWVDLRTSTYLLELAGDVNSFNAFLSWLKLFQYLSFVPRLTMLLGTLASSSSQVSGIAFIAFVVLFGASQAFLLAFGTSLHGYRNLTQSLYSLVRSLLGDFDFESLRVAQPVLGPILFVTFTLLFVFVLLNMFVALILDAFNATKERLALMQDFNVNTLGAEVAAAMRAGVYSLPVAGPLAETPAPAPITHTHHTHTSHTH